MTAMVTKRIFLAAGGTGGHFFPALSLARSLQADGFDVVIMTDARAHKYAGQLDGLEIKLTNSATVFAGGYGQRILAPFRIGLGVLQAMLFYLRRKPSAVIGFGGYPSFVPLLAARLMLIPIAIHEQNAVLGRANRALIRLGAKIAASYVGTRFIPARNRKRLTVTGNPLRSEVLKAAARSYQPPSPAGVFDLLVFGGSQGASILSDVLPAALAKLPKDKQRRIRLVQQCRRVELRETLQKYHALGVEVELRDFFLDLPARMTKAHLIICRSGASTISELAVMGRPSILVPLPGALDQDQMANAVQLSNHKAAYLIEQRLFTPEKLANVLTELMDDPKLLEDMSARAKSRGLPEATGNLNSFARNLVKHAGVGSQRGDV